MSVSPLLLQNLSAGVTITPLYGPESDIEDEDDANDCMNDTMSGCNNEGDEDELSDHNGKELGGLEFIQTSDQGSHSSDDTSNARSFVFDSNKTHSLCPHCDKRIHKKYLSSHLNLHATTNTINYGNLRQRILKVHETAYPKEVPHQLISTSGSGNYERKSPRRTYAYSCHSCPLAFSSASGLAVHSQSHHLSEYLRCSTCRKSFRTLAVLKRHERIHNGTAPYQCTMCPKTFNQPVHLKAHLRRHNGETPYKCEFCPKGYSDSSSLRYHMWKHTGETPYNCPRCPKGFQKKAAWTAHLANHVNEGVLLKKLPELNKNKTSDVSILPLNEESTLYACQYCNETFESYRDICRHEEFVHSTKFSCHDCFQSFSKLAHLKEHQRMLHAFKEECQFRFICARCSMKFQDIASLTQHKVDVHSNE